MKKFVTVLLFGILLVGCCGNKKVKTSETMACEPCQLTDAIVKEYGGK